MATIKDVARIANVSPGTITRYFNNGSLKEENRRRIEEAIIELDYKVNTAARSLRSNKSYTVGIVVTALSSLFTSSIICAIENYFIDKGYGIITCTSMDDYKIENKKIRFLMEKRIDGLIIIPSKDIIQNLEVLKSISSENIPIVTIDNFIEGIECDSVMVDNINGTYGAVEHLIVNGHRRIGIISGPADYATSKERLRGYERALHDFNVPKCEDLIKSGGYTTKEGYEAMKYFMGLQTPPTALLATNYDVTMGALIFINEKNIKIPADISFFGFDSEEFSKILKPHISIVLQPVNGIGEKAAEVMYNRLKNSERQPAVTYRLKTSLILTESVRNISTI
jgi:LacI family transcriptional regulator